MGAIIEAEELVKVFPGGIRAVDGVSFRVEEGEIFGFLGPNGAGKSTTIAMLTTLRRPTGGTARIAGLDVVRDADKVRRVIGNVSQDLAVDDDLTGYENLKLQAGFYRLSRREAEERIKEVLAMVGLTERARDLVETYSGGMRKRLDIACGLLHRPRVLFLDEPTLGLDIQTRREIWDYIRRLREEVGMTIFLTTHYMEEADSLCDRIAIIDRGKIVAIGTPEELKGRVGQEVLEFEFSSGTEEAVAAAVARIKNIPNVREVRRGSGNGYVATVIQGAQVVPALFEAIAGLEVKVGSVSLKRATLDDVFLYYTGRKIREEGGGEGAMRTRMIMKRVRGR